MKKAPVIDPIFTEGDLIIVIDENHTYHSRIGTIERLGSAGEDITYIHARLDGVNTIITFRTFQVQKGS